MKQLGLGLNLSTKKARKREFLEQMERVVPWGYRGLAKNTAQIVTLFALWNLWMARKALSILDGQLPPKKANCN